MMLSARRYSPSKAATLQAPILSALVDDTWLNISAVCARLGRSSDDGAVRYCLKMLADAGVIERTTGPSLRGFTYLYRRKP